ncbi:survival motor neuron protein-like isoform X2 [Xyrichtys novacula]|uniref:Survival motor neuron protein-like isoform X2 n=1 Tax=Xyrichtys novacula TaxID=13765 RepID=A0AAV1FGA1_XYRNO|nr:survival motor neuron protein-like isoform X2 [Xyrichtys novacula]
MSDSAENSDVLSPDGQESGSVLVKEETSPTKVTEKNPELSPGVDVSGCAASEETDGRETLQQVKGLKDKQTASPPAAEPSSTSPKQDWKPGSQCRAVYSGDGLIYPAVVLWVKGQRCCVRYDDYNNEEEHDVSSLLSSNELHGPSRTATTAKGSRWTGVSGRREEKQGERGAERRSDRWREEQHTSSWARERSSHQNKEEKKSADKPTNHSFTFFPPFPPPPQTNSRDSASYIPPPPPPPLTWAIGGQEGAGFDSASNMLMLWYMCGFHTGSYLAQQAFRSGSKD